MTIPCPFHKSGPLEPFWLVALPVLVMVSSCFQGSEPEPAVDAGDSIIWLSDAGTPGWHAVDSEARPRNNSDFVGEVLAIYFGFTNCQGACPTALAKLATAREILSSEGASFSVALVTVDPERDTLAKLGAYVELFDSSFIGLRPENSDQAPMRDVFRVYAKKTHQGQDYEVNHSDVIYLIGCNGQLRAAVRSGSSAADIATAVRSLRGEPACSVSTAFKT